MFNVFSLRDVSKKRKYKEIENIVLIPICSPFNSLRMILYKKFPD